MRPTPLGTSLPFRLPPDARLLSDAHDWMRWAMRTQGWTPDPGLGSVDPADAPRSDARAAAAVRALPSAVPDAQRQVATLVRARIALDREAGVYWSAVHDALWMRHARALPPDSGNAPRGPGGLEALSDPQTLELIAGAYDAENLERLAAWARGQGGAPEQVVHLLAFRAGVVRDLAVDHVPDVTPGLVDAVVHAMARAGAQWGGEHTPLVQLAWRVRAGSDAWARLAAIIAASSEASPNASPEASSALHRIAVPGTAAPWAPGASAAGALPTVRGGAGRLAEVLRARSKARGAALDSPS